MKTVEGTSSGHQSEEHRSITSLAAGCKAEFTALLLLGFDLVAAAGALDWRTFSALCALFSSVPCFAFVVFLSFVLSRRVRDGKSSALESAEVSRRSR